MKKTNQFLQAVLASAAAVVILQANASAQTITPLNPTAPVVTNTIPSNVGPAGTTGADGYDFFDFNNPSRNNANGHSANVSTNLASLPSYITGLTFDSTLLQYSSNFTPDMTIAATTYHAGLIYSATNATVAAPQTFLTFQLTSGVPSAFDLGVLRDYADHTQYILSLYSGTPSPATLLSTTAINDGTKDSGPLNQFYYGEVFGASAGDFVVITGDNPGGSDQVTIGGITFDSVATPEPSTIALMLAGLGTLALVARLRRSNG
jgi:hypothetical protein